MDYFKTKNPVIMSVGEWNVKHLMTGPKGDS